MKQVSRHYLIIAFVFTIWITGCAQIPWERILPPEVTPTPSPQLTVTVNAAALPNDQTSVPSPQPLLLRVWLPPEFDAKVDSEAARLFKARIEAFQTRRGVRVELRVKSLDGDGGMVNSLSTANAVAPLALPDVVALPRSVLEVAVLKGLLYPVDGFTHLLNDPDWFPYARQLANINDSTYGIPFAGDAMVLVYKQQTFVKPPRTWDAFLSSKTPLLFPAAQPESFFTISEYITSGGILVDEEGKPTLDSTVLTNVFGFYEQARRTEQMPYWLTQFETNQQAWQAFLEGRSAMVITWLTRYYAEKPKDTKVDLIPTAGGEDFSLVNGWCWALTNPDADRRILAAELAEYLVSTDFIADWSEAAGFLPPTNSALLQWENQNDRAVAERVINSAYLIPSNEIIQISGTTLKDGTVAILKNQVNAQTAVQSVIEKLKTPTQ